MPTKQELDSTYLGTALLHAQMSKCIRKKVGAVLVTKHGVTLTGYNGSPAGLPNACEYINEDGEYITKSSTLHAELNCILKAAKEGISVLDSTVYVTLMPCVACSAMMVQVGVKRLVYQENYRDASGVDLLSQAGIVVEKLEGIYND